jgi:MFS superfamily sulfate permease-like transporter
VISLVGFMEAISIAKAIAAKTKQKIDPNQELIGQGLANLVGAATQSFPVSGSFSRSAVNINAGAKTGMSSVITAAFVLLTLLFLTPLLYHLPQAVLAAVIIMAVIGLVNFGAVKHAWQANRHDGIAAVVTFVATLAFAPHLDKGIVVGAGLAIGLYLFRTMTPRVAILGRHADGTLRDAAVHSLPPSKVVTAVRFDGRLYFANVAYFEGRDPRSGGRQSRGAGATGGGRGHQRDRRLGRGSHAPCGAAPARRRHRGGLLGPEEAGGRRHARHRAAGFHRRGAAVSHGGCGTGCDPRRGGGAR